MTQTPTELIAFGRELVIELESLASNYHIKSDEHDILLYEAATIDAALKRLVDGKVIPDNFRASTLLSAWGAALRRAMPEVRQRVESFHDSFHRIEADG